MMRASSSPAARPPAARPRAPTLEDVARAAGVSRQTVSNVINRPARVREATRDRVRSAIRELGYRPNRLARSLQSNLSCSIGMQVPRRDGGQHNPLMGAFLDCLAAAAGAHGYQLLLIPSEVDAVRSYEELHRARLLDGVVLAETERDDRRPAALRAAGIPTVAFGTAPDTPYVEVDGRAGTRAAVAHLVGRGHTRVAFVGWPTGSLSGDARAAGYAEGLAEAGLAVDPRLDLRGENAMDTGGVALQRLLDLADPPSAAVATSDLIAAGLLRSAAARGVAVPDDLAVVGYDDSIARLLTPQLTSVCQPLGEVAERLVQLLTSRLAGRRVLEPVLLTPTLVVRGSS